MIKVHFLLFLLICLAATKSSGQTIERSDSGDLIVTYSDGSWREFMASDSLLLEKEYRAFLKKEEPEQVEVAPPDVQTQPDTVKNRAVIETQENRESDDELSEKDERMLVLTERRLMLTERLRRVESGYIQLSEKDLRKVNEELASINHELAQLAMEPEEETEVADEPAVTEAESTAYSRNKYMFEPVSAEDIKSSCHVTSVTDELTGDISTYTDSEFFFQYTPDEARHILKDQHYMHVESSLLHRLGQVFLTLEFTIRSESLVSEYGSLHEGSRLKMDLMNDKTITLYNGVEDRGRRDAVDGVFYYKSHYLLDEDALKELGKEDIDTVQINWSAGIEEYEVYYIDLIRNQVNCLLDRIENQ